MSDLTIREKLVLVLACVGMILVALIVVSEVL